MSLESLTSISRFYGSNPDYVLAGGGNTSWKDGDTLYVKGSGMPLAGVTPDSFVKMDRKALARIWEKQYPESNDERESAVLADMMTARMAGEEQKRPSVEALLHNLLPFAYVVHLHPALVNGLTCSQRGESAMKEIFGIEAVWIPSSNPGYILAKTVKTEMETYSARYGKPPAIIFMQNHGVFAGDSSVEGVKQLYDFIMRKIGSLVQREPCFTDEQRTLSDCASVGGVGKTLAELAKGVAVFMQCKEVAALVKDRGSFAPVTSAFSPDHIVYAGSDPLFIGTDTEAGINEAMIQKAWSSHVQKNGRNPKIIAVQGTGVFGAGVNEKAANFALDLFKDTIRVSVYAECFGGPLFMTQDKIDFINNWEVERFRTSISAK
ncbi:MAG: class II aldolase/adducin family protein [Treponema sp.]|nr:class II aldolase/adducin family protein [Treponema sp.]